MGSPYFRNDGEPLVTNVSTHKLSDNEKVIMEYMTDNSDDTGFDGSMKDIADIMDIPIKEVLVFFNKCFQRNYLIRIDANRHNFVDKRINVIL